MTPLRRAGALGTLTRTMVTGIVVVGSIVACSTLTGANDYSAKPCLPCLETLCGSDVDACNADRGCAAMLACIETRCPEAPDSPGCIPACMVIEASSLTSMTQDRITGVRGCGVRNCGSCAPPTTDVSDAAAAVEAAPAAEAGPVDASGG